MDPEEAHDRAIRFLSWSSRHEVMTDALSAWFDAPSLPIRLFGLDFPNPIGVAAGLDKRAAAAPAWPALGFGFSELGGVTKHSQPGNPAPRMFRVPSEEAIINRMGFNNAGADAMAEALRGWRERGRWPKAPVGINLGKSKITPLEEAVDDYAYSFEQLWSLADFFVVNVSSPNTPNLRQLQDKKALDEIVQQLQAINRVISARENKSPKPILIKVAPDLTWEALDDVLALVESRNLAGLVATNTTIERPHTTSAEANRTYQEAGGLSGRPLQKRSTEVIRHLYQQSRGRVPIIGVGGIFSVEDAWEKITAGASLLQIYTGLIYEGPSLPKRLVAGLAERMRAEGIRQLADAVGRDAA
jgi:dihydroorotate dehydrogenase